MPDPKDNQGQNQEQPQEQSTWTGPQGTYKPPAKGTGTQGAASNFSKTSEHSYTKADGWQKSDQAPDEDKKSLKVSLVQKQWADTTKDGEKYIGPNASVKGKNDVVSGAAEIGLGYYEAKAKSEISFDVSKMEGELTVIKAEAKGAVVHAEAEGRFDIGNALGKLGDAIFGGSPKPTSPPSVPGGGGGGPMAARVGDLTSHGTPLAPGIGSVNVLIGGMPAWRSGVDFHACPIVKGVVPDVGGVVPIGTPTVLINFMMACRVGDIIAEVPGGPNSIAMGCPTVLIGPSGGGGGGGPAPGASPAKDSNLAISAKAEGDLLTAEASGELAGVWDKERKGVVGKVGAMAAVAKGSIGGELSIPIPFTDHAITLGAKAEGSALSIGGEAEASAGWNKEKGFKATVGAKGALGIGGGVQFSIGFK